MDYTPDPVGIGAYLREDPELRAELHRRAELGLFVAAALAPRLQRPARNRVRGALAASGHVEDAGLDDAKHELMAVNVTFDIDYAAAATYRRAHNPDHAARAYLLAAIPIIEEG